MTQPVDPAALAKKLAEEAKARNLAKKLAEQAKAAAPAPAPKKSSLADRAPKPMSAYEAMRLAIEQEKAEEAAKAAAPKPAPKPAAPKAAAKPAPKPVAPAAVPAQAALPDAGELLAQRLPSYTVQSVTAVSSLAAFKAVWTAHRVRAAAEQNAALVVTADVLIDAAGRLPAGSLFAAKITGADESLAVFIDTANGALIGAAAPADLYLAGI